MTVQHVIDAVERIAPPHFAAEWDNVGLLIGSPHWPGRSILLTIDLTEEVLREAIDHQINALIAYHPPIFHPLKAITDATLAQHIVLEAARAGIAVYSPHTALDAAPGGVNDWLAGGVMGLEADGSGRGMDGIPKRDALRSEGTPIAVDRDWGPRSPEAPRAKTASGGDVRALQPAQFLPESEQCKVITFCPANAVDAIRNGLATAGAGRIGEYKLCSFELRGQGTFFGGESTSPAVGAKGQMERVDEVRLEMVCSRAALGLAVIALREWHPYEEPPMEIYPLLPRPQRTIGHGRRVTLDQKATLAELVRRIKQRLGVQRLRIARGRPPEAPPGAARGPRSQSIAIGDPPDEFRTIGLCAGAGGSLLDDAIAQGCEVFFTGEMRHHDVLRAQSRGCTVILAGHTNTERGYLPALKQRLAEFLPERRIEIARADRDPLEAH